MAKQPKRKSYPSMLWPSAERTGAPVAVSDLGETLAIIRVALEKAGLDKTLVDVRSRPDATYPPVLTFDAYLRIAQEALSVIDDAVWVVERLDKSIADANLLADAELKSGNSPLAWLAIRNALKFIAQNKAIVPRSDLAWARRVVREAERAERRQPAQEDAIPEDEGEGE